MADLQISLEGDGIWPDLLEKQEGQIIHVTSGMAIAALSGGMESGRPSVAFRLNLPDGRVVVSEVSMRLFLTAADMFRIRYGREIENRSSAHVTLR